MYKKSEKKKHINKHLQAANGDKMPTGSLMRVGHGVPRSPWKDSENDKNTSPKQRPRAINLNSENAAYVAWCRGFSLVFGGWVL
jgi:hypothetical protein